MTSIDSIFQALDYPAQRKRYYYLECHKCGRKASAIVGERRSLIPSGWKMVSVVMYVIDERYRFQGAAWFCPLCIRRGDKVLREEDT